LYHPWQNYLSRSIKNRQELQARV